jgi:hypothetical protein
MRKDAEIEQKAKVWDIYLFIDVYIRDPMQAIETMYYRARFNLN